MIFPVRAYRTIPRGFTLIELMAVIVIIGIMASLIGIGFHNNSSADLHDEAYRIKKSMQLARQDALASGKDYGFVLHENYSYQFYYFDDASLDWIAATERHFASHSLPVNYEIDIKVEGQDIDLRKIRSPESADKIRDFGDEKIMPAPLLLSDGQTTPFELIISDKKRGEKITLVGDGLSDIEMTDGEKL